MQLQKSDPRIGKTDRNCHVYYISVRLTATQQVIYGPHIEKGGGFPYRNDLLFLRSPQHPPTLGHRGTLKGQNAMTYLHHMTKCLQSVDAPSLQAF